MESLFDFDSRKIKKKIVTDSSGRPINKQKQDVKI